MEAFGVSCTVVREAISAAAGSRTGRDPARRGHLRAGAKRHPTFRISPDQLGTLRDVIALLELRISVETEAAALAAVPQRGQSAADGTGPEGFQRRHRVCRDAVAADVDFHQEIARSTQNPRFAELMKSLGAGVIPRSRLGKPIPVEPERLAYLRRVNQEHESIFRAIAAQDVDAARAAMRTHLSNSRERHRRGESGHR